MSAFFIEFVEEICSYVAMSLPPLSLPDDLASAHAALLAEREARLHAEAEATKAKAELSSIEALNAHLQLLIEPPRLCRRPFGLSYAAIAGASSMA
ncbi:hypothetical protein ACC664_38825, partial [Rhizobium johnstonii]